MDSSSYKRYNVHGYDSRQHLEHYFSDKKEMVFAEDTLKFPIENLKRTFETGHIKGDVLIDLSTGSCVHQLYAACEFFRDIIVLKVSDRCILELKRYLDSRTGAFDWGHAIKLHGEIQGNSDQLQDKEGKLRSVIPHVVKYDFEKKNITDPIVLPLADCIISAWLLDTVCKDQDDYIRYLRKFSGMLKPGGHLILIGALGTTYLTVGKERFHAFTYDEDFVRKTLAAEGFVIDNFKARKTTAMSDLIDYKFTIFIVAHKEK
ncbi:indolethylamine N-methyltransferase-like [Hyla sarda]|uniref:indolethylamine N-methyltransferase-like n=1 Tax=Hyla sarda TaxID=327740 RepID=UPI0024C31132|nr:indolethylamine N-methyltransferase-like [Hyla sarda]